MVSRLPSFTDRTSAAPLSFAVLALGLSGCMGEILVPPSGGAPSPERPDPGTTPGPSSETEPWAAQCASCHGTFEGSSTFSTGNANGDFRLDAAAVMAEHGDGLAAYIERAMPFGAAGACVGPCAETTARSIASRAGAPPAPSCEDDALTFGKRELKLLTSREYQRSLEDLLGVAEPLGARVANNDGARGGFPHMGDRAVNDATLEAYIANAEAVAARAVAEGRPFRCENEACAERFVDEFLFRAFRGPVSPDQRAAYLALFRERPEDGMRLALEAALTSPYFLYRIEAGVDLDTARARGESTPDGVPAGTYVLTSFEVASALAFRLTGSTPDASLLAAARAGALTTRAQVRAQVERLVDSPRGRSHFASFVRDWFELEGVKSASRPGVPELTAMVKDAMLREVEAHFLHVFHEASAPFHELFDGDYTFLNRTLADYYGIAGAFGDDFVKTPVEGRGGPLASGAFMTVNAHVERSAPILRAVRARETALCQHIDPPNSPLAGQDIDAQRAAAQMRVEERERREGALSSRDFYFLYTDGIDACAGCHEKIINPMFGMEDFDHAGRLRPRSGAGTVLERVSERDMPVSLAGTLHGVASTSDPTTLEFSGAKDLSNQIARTDAVKSCLVTKGFRFVTGRPASDRDLDAARGETLDEAERASNACLSQRMRAALEASGESPRAMFVEIATESFLRLRR